MHIESVTAIAFGPFRNATLTFSPQLTIVYGPNEAGKSSWHAAIYAALCGMRRARGQPRVEDREFSDLRRPWNSDLWEVHTLVQLNDGRRVEVRQNLADLARCSAVDADFGRDLTNEILNEGTPDATKWLGLNRQSFLAVACVRQAQIQAITASAGSLQEELQRAAASAASDATATTAITTLESFLSENVGLERANSSKPLQAAKVRVADAEKDCTDARRKHAEWLRLESEAIRLRKNADDAARAKRELELLRIRREAREWEARLLNANRMLKNSLNL
jgi:DNA repair protein SbcC/Rad50